MTINDDAYSIKWLSTGESATPTQGTQNSAHAISMRLSRRRIELLAKDTQVSRNLVPVSRLVRASSNKDETVVGDCKPGQLDTLRFALSGTSRYSHLRHPITRVWALGHDHPGWSASPDRQVENERLSRTVQTDLWRAGPSNKKWHMAETEETGVKEFE